MFRQHAKLRYMSVHAAAYGVHADSGEFEDAISATYSERSTNWLRVYPNRERVASMSSRAGRALSLSFNR